MTEKEWEKVHLGSTVEYSAFNLLSFLTGGLKVNLFILDVHASRIGGERNLKTIKIKLKKI